MIDLLGLANFGVNKGRQNMIDSINIIMNIINITFIAIWLFRNSVKSLEFSTPKHELNVLFSIVFEYFRFDSIKRSMNLLSFAFYIAWVKHTFEMVQEISGTTFMLYQYEEHIAKARLFV